MLMTICDVSTPLGGAEGGVGGVMTSFLVITDEFSSETCLIIVTDAAYDVRTSFRTHFENDGED
jgi:hypothetical protein